jgi:hypothetical protein
MGSQATAILSQILIACLFIIGGLFKVYADNPDGAGNGIVYGDVAVMFIMPIGLNNIGWKMYMVNASWDIVILGLIVSFLPKSSSHS